MTRTRQQKRDADAGIAPPAPAPAPKRKRRAKKLPPPIEPAAKAKLVRVLASEPFFLREISSALVYRDVTSLSLVDKGADALLSKPENSDAWKPFVTALDTWKSFGKIDEAQKSLMEQHYGFRKICATLATGTCVECGGGGAYINALSCERTCLGCWSCRDCGEHGTEGAQRSQMCSPGYAKTHFLITDTDIKKCAMLHIDDATKAHGLMNAKMRAILVRDAQKLAIARHGSLDAVEAVKAIRHAKSMETYRAKIEALEAPLADKIAAFEDRKAKAEDKYTAAMAAWKALTASDIANDILKAGPPPYRSFYESRPRAEGKYPKKPSDLGSSWNFLARNQRARCMQSVGEKYGLHKVAPAELTRRKDAPVFVVTESTDEAAIKEQFSSHGSVKGFGENIFEVTHRASPGCTIVVAMKCDLRKQATSCAPEKRSTVAGEYGASVGGSDQNHCLMLDDELTLIGMPGSCLYSDTACVWAQGEFIQLENLRLRTQPVDSPANRSPCLVLSGSGRTFLKDCIVELGPGGGMTVLTHSKCHFRNSTVVNFGTAPGSATLHFEDDATLEPPDLLLTGNTFAWHGPESIFPHGIFTGAETDEAQTEEFRRQLQDSQNTTTRARSRETRYVFLAVSRNDPAAPPVAIQPKQTARGLLGELLSSSGAPQIAAMAAGMALMANADANTPVSDLLAKLAKRSDIETSPLDGDVAAPWLYVASRPDAPRPHPLTTIGELEAPEPYVDTSMHGQYMPARKVLYLIDERTAAEPMVIE